MILHAGETYIRSEAICSLNANRCAPLLVISPDHGAVSYVWELNSAAEDVIPVYANTPLLFVDTCGSYKCTVGNKVFNFQVEGTLQ